jgi:predicted nucleotidyltransferase
MAHNRQDDARALIDVHRAAISEAVMRHKGRSVAIFGSVARGEATSDSDIDFLVDFEEGSSLFDLLHLMDELEQLLGRRVDVVSTRALKARDEHIRREAVDL